MKGQLEANFDHGDGDGLLMICRGIHPILKTPWGHGARRVGNNTESLDCDDKPHKIRRNAGFHVYPDGAVICTPCARIRAAAHYPNLYPDIPT